MLTDLHAVIPDRVAQVTCRDVAGRPRAVSVTPLVDQRVMVVLPPGENAVLEPAQADELGDEVFRTVGTAQVIGPAPAASILGVPLCTLRCRDGIGRERGLRIAAERGRVVVTSPPGGVVVLRPYGAALFRTALRDAARAVRFEAVIT